MRRVFLGVAALTAAVVVATACQSAAPKVAAQEPAATQGADGSEVPANPEVDVSGSPGMTAASALRPVAPRASDNGAGGVSVVANWLGSTDGASLSFGLGFTTHSGDLSRFDFAANSVLRDSTGQEVLASGWQVRSPDSHHLTGVLSFPASAVSDGASSVTIVIRDLYRIPERSLTFELER